MIAWYIHCAEFHGSHQIMKYIDFKMLWTIGTMKSKNWGWKQHNQIDWLYNFKILKLNSSLFLLKPIGWERINKIRIRSNSSRIGSLNWNSCSNNVINKSTIWEWSFLSQSKQEPRWNTSNKKSRNSSDRTSSFVAKSKS